MQTVRKKIQDAQDEIDDISMPEWMVTDRNDLPEYSDYGDNADRMRSIGQVFPCYLFPGGCTGKSDYHDTNGGRTENPDRYNEGSGIRQSMRLHPNICCMPFLPLWEAVFWEF